MTRSLFTKRVALDFFHQAYRSHMRNSHQNAIRLYKESIRTYPTAEAYTFHGWVYSSLGEFDAAIDQCHVAIHMDPNFGNPYNDIGAYLIEKGELDEAIPWLKKAINASRYSERSFPWLNLGRIWELRAQWPRTLICYKKALQHDPDSNSAVKGIARISILFN